MRIDWVDGSALALDCPVCGSTAPKPATLAVDSPFATQGRLTLVACPQCGSAFYDNLEPPAYEDSSGIAPAIKFYVEQGAGIDVLVELLSRFPSDRIRHFLEVGCGFGFSLDFARFTYGWQVRGIDPSPIASAGREALKLDITPAYLTPDTDLDGSPFDLVLCSEVIEHVSDPHRFIKDIGHALADSGVLALTTPNAAAIRRETATGKLLPILSPGFHLILFSGPSLRRLLHASGFAHVQVWEDRHTLHAVASRHPYPVRESPAMDRTLYRRYLAERSTTLPPDTPVGVGFAYRLFRECVFAGDFAAAEPVFERLRAAYSSLYGIDPAAPQRIAREFDASAGFEEFARTRPFNLTGALYFRGIAAMNQLGDYGAALEYFRAAARVGVATRTALRSIGADDSETENLVWRARIHAVYCLAYLDPPAAVSELDRLAAPPRPGDPPPELWQVPIELVAPAWARLLMQLVSLRRPREAARLVIALRPDDAVVKGLMRLARLAVESAGGSGSTGRSLPSLGRLARTASKARRWLAGL